MSNEIYLSSNLSATLDRLPKDQQTRVARAISSLGDDVLNNSYIVAGDDSPGGGLRAAHAGNFRLLFRYVPASHTVIITDLSKLQADELTTAIA